MIVRLIPRVETGCMSYFIQYLLEGWPPKPSGWREISERNTSP